MPDLRATRCIHARVALTALTAVLTVTAPAVQTTLARANVWMHVSCINPDQSPAPSEGWSGDANGSVSIGSTNNANCAPGSPMTAHLSNQSAAAAGADEHLTYTPPAGSTLIGGSLLVGLSADGYGYRAVGTAALLTPAYQYDASNVFLQCVAVLQACQNGLPNYYGEVSVPPNRGGSLYLAAGCSGQIAGTFCSTGGSHGAWSLVAVSYANLLLSSSSIPTATDFAGSLLTPGAHGIAKLSFTASDPDGPGLYRATVSINGNAVFDATPNANAGKCAPVGTDPASGALMWDFQQPCPKTQRIVIPVDTTNLKDSEHELKVTLLSAAQNASTVLTQTITTDNRTTISGDLTSDPPAAPPPPEPVYTIDLDPPTQALTRGVRRGWTRSSLTLSGTLRTSAGIPAPGVAVGLFARDGRDGTRRAIGSAISDAAGHWVVTAPRGPSRTLTIAYGSGMQATVSIRQTVTPAVTLHVRPLEGARFRFSGRLLVRPLGSPPPLIVVQVRTDRRPWQLLGSAIRTSRSGRFTLTYAAGRKLAGYRFTFRALAPATGLFATGISPTTETVAR